MTDGKKKKKWLRVPAVILLLTAVFLAYTGQYYHSAAEGLQALESDSVTVEKTDFGWRFDGPADDTALIFYPGAKVEASAYAPLLHRLAENGMDTFLVQMPFHLALFGANKAEGIQARYDYENWYIGGHSLGGVMAVKYAAAHELRGIILLASYPTETVEEPMLLVYGSEDGVVNRDRIGEAERYGTAETVVIEGGNHAGFGNYGEQAGDKASAISAEEQQAETAAAIAAWLPRQNGSGEEMG